MNIRSVGPALYLAPWAGTKDGEFDFVCVREEDRQLFVEHLDARLAGKQNKFPLPMRKFRELEIVWEEGQIHLDDAFWPAKKDGPRKPARIKITLRSPALVFNRPRETAKY